MKILPFLLLTLVFISCENEETVYPFDQSPYVEFDNLAFYDVENGSDELVLSFIVWDLEGDIGINGNNFDYPFHQFDIVLDSDDEIVHIGNEVTPPLYLTPMSQVYDWENDVYQFISFSDYKSLLSHDDSRSIFNCDSYLLFENSIGYDTIFGSQNRNRNSLQVDLLTAEGKRFNFNEIFQTDQCDFGDFDAVMPHLDEIDFFSLPKGSLFEVEKRDKYSFRVTYSIRSFLMKAAFGDEQFEIQLQVLDRELNKSNFGSSGLITLQEITN